MSSTELDGESLKQMVTTTIQGTGFRRATFGGAVRHAQASPWIRVAIRPVELRGQTYLQFSYFDSKKDVSRNFRGPVIAEKLDEIMAVGFSDIHLATCAEELNIRTTRKGRIFLSRRKLEPAAPVPPGPHNRVKDVPLPEGRADRLLEALGILTRDGHVRPALRPKYTQINEFLKHLTHVLDDAGLRSLGREVVILDCGCGLSYLTLAVHHYLNDVLGIPARIRGVDVNEEVIRKSRERSERLGADRVTFARGRIDAAGVRPDIVLALHACDTATDDAIAQAIAAQATILLCVPCCHHNLNDRLRPGAPADVLRPLLRHGILYQRTADALTDAFRALALRIMGYRTDVVEFISPEHTARNLMIRAVRGVPVGDLDFVREYVALSRFWGVTPYIEEVLGEPFRCLLAPAR
jgi:SAM-dependent methyltransferase